MNSFKQIIIAFILMLLAIAVSCNKETAFPIYINGNGVVDLEGNEYKTVIIGDQEWMAENLKSNLFCSGDSIPAIGNSTQVKIYENDPVNDLVFGKLYNFNAVSDGNGLCPCGWSIPSDLDYSKLIDYLGGHESALVKMKSSGTLNSGTGLWVDIESISSGNNASGFNALPAGYYNYDKFREKDTISMFWSASEKDFTPITYVIRLNKINKFIFNNPSPLVKSTLYYSVRCIKNLP